MAISSEILQPENLTGNVPLSKRICKLHHKGTSSYAIAKTLTDEGIRTRYYKEFTTTTIQRILRRIQ